MKDCAPPPPESESLRARVDQIYTPLAKAVEELYNRRKRFNGRTPGRDWLPAWFPADQRGGAFLFRFIATPCFETRRFLELAGECDLLPVIQEYLGDKFVSRNPLKYALARMGFRCGQDRHGHRLVEYLNVMDWAQQGQPLRELRTLWGEPLATLHHELLASALNGFPHPHLYDCSHEYALDGCPISYYRHLFRCFLADGILFEDYLMTNEELPFTRDVVLPAFEAVTLEFGLKPLIVRIDPTESASSPHWFWYPAELKPFVQQRLQ